jgi:hypothetical protein
MEKQLDSLTELVKELTKSKPNKSLHQQFYELKIQTHTLRNDLISIRQMQQSLQENFQIELQQTNKNIQVNSLFYSCDIFHFLLFFVESITSIESK